MLYHIDGGKLGRHIKRRGIKNTKKYFYRIGYSVELGAAIMRRLWNQYGSYEVALTRYAYKTKFFKKYKHNPYKAWYVRAVMGKEE